MDVSVVLSTYNQPEWLELVLWGYSRQDFSGFELIIADDGSREETRALISRFAARSPVPIRHLWHPDEGYRRSIILNAAILASQGDYLVFSDGDCIPRHDFVRTHVEMARAGRFLSGGSVYLSMDVSKKITSEHVVSGKFADAAWLAGQGETLGRHRFRLVPRDWRAALLDRLTTTNPTWNLNNASTWRDAVFEVNGMEAEMQYGGADRALGSRLENLGLKGKLIRYRAVLLHLDHSRPYKTRESIDRNKGIRRRIVKNREIQAVTGLAELGARRKDGGFLEFVPGEDGGREPAWGPGAGTAGRGSHSGEAKPPGPK